VNIGAVIASKGSIAHAKAHGLDSLALAAALGVNKRNQVHFRLIVIVAAG
jgi:hypothetical protein